MHDEVLIVGAGPVEMVAARYLAGEGIPVTVIESAPTLPINLRPSTFRPPTPLLLALTTHDTKCLTDLQLDAYSKAHESKRLEMFPGGHTLLTPLNCRPLPRRLETGFTLI